MHKNDEQLLRQIDVELVVRGTLAVFAIDVCAFADILAHYYAGSQAGQCRFEILEPIARLY